MREKSLVGLFTIKLTKEGKIDDNDLYKINTRAVKRGHYTVKTVKKKKDFGMMLYSTGAVEKKRVSWVLRREVCTWFCFATCTHNRNEGKHRVGGRWTSFQENTCLKKQKKGCKPAMTTTHRPAQTDSRGSRVTAGTGRKTCDLRAVVIS